MVGHRQLRCWSTGVIVFDQLGPDAHVKSPLKPVGNVGSRLTTPNRHHTYLFVHLFKPPQQVRTPGVASDYPYQETAGQRHCHGNRDSASVVFDRSLTANAASRSCKSSVDVSHVGFGRCVSLFGPALVDGRRWPRLMCLTDPIAGLPACVLTRSRSSRGGGDVVGAVDG